MCHALLQDARLWSFLHDVDADIARGAKATGCLRCGAPLHCAHFGRKPRGPDTLPAGLWRRFSFCCSEDGCRRRVTPPSVRFLGRRVFLMAVVVLVTAMRQGPTARGSRDLERLVGASRRSIERWRVWWQEVFPQTPFWARERSRFARAADSAGPLGSIMLHFQAESALEAFVEALRFLSAVTSGPGPPSSR